MHNGVPRSVRVLVELDHGALWQSLRDSLNERYTTTIARLAVEPLDTVQKLQGEAAGIRRALVEMDRIETEARAVREGGMEESTHG